MWQLDHVVARLNVNFFIFFLCVILPPISTKILSLNFLPHYLLNYFCTTEIFNSISKFSVISHSLISG